MADSTAGFSSDYVGENKGTTNVNATGEIPQVADEADSSAMTIDIAKYGSTKARRVVIKGIVAQ